MTGRTLLPDVRSGYIISVCTVEGWQELTLEFEDILQRYVFRFGFVWFQHILYMQFFHLDLPCTRCGQNSAAPFTEYTVPCESLLAFGERVHIITRDPKCTSKQEGSRSSMDQYSKLPCLENPHCDAGNMLF